MTFRGSCAFWGAGMAGPPPPTCPTPASLYSAASALLPSKGLRSTVPPPAQSGISAASIERRNRLSRPTFSTPSSRRPARCPSTPAPASRRHRVHHDLEVLLVAYPGRRRKIPGQVEFAVEGIQVALSRRGGGVGCRVDDGAETLVFELQQVSHEFGLDGGLAYRREAIRESFILRLRVELGRQTLELLQDRLRRRLLVLGVRGSRGGWRRSSGRFSPPSPNERMRGNNNHRGRRHLQDRPRWNLGADESVGAGTGGVFTAEGHAHRRDCEAEAQRWDHPVEEGRDQVSGRRQAWARIRICVGIEATARAYAKGDGEPG